MKKILLLILVFAIGVFPDAARAEDGPSPGVTAIIDIGNRPVAIEVDDLDACVRVIASRINNLKALYQDTLTTTDVVGQCFSHDGQLLASGRCGVKSGSGQITHLCVPLMQ